jgi:CMP-N-acetylneuraminic acid synthetase
MFRGGRVLGVIPARGGSKRLPNKNILHLKGKPLIAWTIQTAQESQFIDKIVVSTEDYKIAGIAFEWGIHDVIERSKTLSDDRATTYAVVIEVLEILRERGERFEYLVLLQPTSPLRTTAHIECAFNLMDETNASGAISVCRTEHPVEWMGKIPKDGFMDSFIRDSGLEKNSHDLSPSFQINGAIYIVRVDLMLDEKTLFLKSGTAAYVMDRASSVDIDDDYDLELAVWLLNRREEGLAGS